MNITDALEMVGIGDCLKFRRSNGVEMFISRKAGIGPISINVYDNDSHNLQATDWSLCPKQTQ